ncbi:MAG TPA: hypothetical protein VGO62_16490 [Myxococcota bacterium]|jgi:hypothetical protein
MPVSPDRAFHNALQITAQGGRGKPTITASEASAALQQLKDAPVDEQSAIVQRFLDGSEADALSPGARRTLAEFVSAQQSAPSAGARSVVDVRAHNGEPGARARDRLQQLLASGSAGSVADVASWLDSAADDVKNARGRLQELAQQALAGVAGDGGLQALLATRTGKLTKRALDELRAWLKRDDASATSGSASTAPSGNGAHDEITIKYPSDAEDAHGSPHGVVEHSMKYPSDNEDSGTGVGDPIKLGRSLSPDRSAHVKSVVARAAPQLSWQAGGVVEHHPHTRFVELALGGGLTAFVPVGALTPTAAALDPNDAREVYVERAAIGGKQSAGPLAL